MPTIQDLPRGADDTPAIAAVDRPSLTYRALRGLLRRTKAALNCAGIGRGDRVAIVLANGPEAASAFITVAVAATAAPLNPTYTVDEVAFYLRDLGARAIILRQGEEGAARQAAAAAGIVIFELVPGEAAGDFRLQTETSGSAVHPWACGAGRYRTRAAYLRHDGAAKDRAANARKHLRVR